MMSFCCASRMASARLALLALSSPSVISTIARRIRASLVLLRSLDRLGPYLCSLGKTRRSLEGFGRVEGAIKAQVYFALQYSHDLRRSGRKGRGLRLATKSRDRPRHTTFTSDD